MSNNSSGNDKLIMWGSAVVVVAVIIGLVFAFGGSSDSYKETNQKKASEILTLNTLDVPKMKAELSNAVNKSLQESKMKGEPKNIAQANAFAVLIDFSSRYFSGGDSRKVSDAVNKRINRSLNNPNKESSDKKNVHYNEISKKIDATSNVTARTSGQGSSEHVVEVNMAAIISAADASIRNDPKIKNKGKYQKEINKMLLDLKKQIESY